ncbi:MAG: GWxTD domain-containing protein [Candidatus Aminicenantes bacterium]|nr:GWxTD domain-containing protein [Candidatus Aminicenantes bacterium]
MNKSLLYVMIVLLLLLLPSCRLYKLERQLDPENAEFLSKVRYIITKEERKIFLELPDEEKENFQEEFWKRRDPDPETEENEFKKEYFKRVDRADELFLGEGKPGWLTDRGRIYILFGPPSDRMTYPMGTGPYGRCQETWLYGNFPVIFVDGFCSGTYRLVTYNLAHLQALNRALASSQKTFEKEKGLFDFNCEIKTNLIHPDRMEGLIIIEIPYAVIWFKSEDDKLETTLDLSLELMDSSDQLLWQYEDSIVVRIDEIELQKKSQQKHTLKIPFTLEADLERLGKRKNLFHILLKNRTGGEEAKKVKELKLEDLDSLRFLR